MHKIKNKKTTAKKTNLLNYLERRKIDDLIGCKLGEVTRSLDNEVKQRNAELFCKKYHNVIRRYNSLGNFLKTRSRTRDCVREFNYKSIAWEMPGITEKTLRIIKTHFDNRFVFAKTRKETDEILRDIAKLSLSNIKKHF